MNKEKLRETILTISHSDICGQPEISVEWCSHCSHYLDSDIRCAYLLDKILAIVKQHYEQKRLDRPEREKIARLISVDK